MKKIKKINLTKASGGSLNETHEDNYPHSMNREFHGYDHSTVNYDFNTMGF